MCAGAWGPLAYATGGALLFSSSLRLVCIFLGVHVYPDVHFAYRVYLLSPAHDLLPVVWFRFIFIFARQLVPHEIYCSGGHKEDKPEGNPH